MVSVDPLASAPTDEDDGREILVADEGGTRIAEVIGTTGNGGGGMAHSASVGKHSMNTRRGGCVTTKLLSHDRWKIHCLKGDELPHGSLEVKSSTENVS